MPTPLVYKGYATDPAGTVRIEDAFALTERNGRPYVVICVSSIFTQRKEELLARVTGDNMFLKHPRLTHQDTSNFVFSPHIERKAICVHIPITNNRTLVVDKIEIADVVLQESLPTNWTELAKSNENYFPGVFLRTAEDLGLRGQPHWTVREQVVYTLMGVFNKVCASYLTENMVPFIVNFRGEDMVVTSNKTHHESRGVVSRGHIHEIHAIFNKPLRDRRAFINNAQLSHFIKHGRPLFTWQELCKVVGE